MHAARNPPSAKLFSVDQSVRLEAGDRAGIQRLIQYFLRCPFSQARMIEVTEAGKVLYKTGDKRRSRISSISIIATR